MTPSEFVSLCRKLTKLGATSIEACGFKATFPQPRAAVRGDVAEPSPSPAPRKRTPKQPTPLSPEDQLVAETEARLRDLGVDL